MLYEVITQNEGGEIKPFGLAVATKEKEPNIGLFEFPQSVLDAAMDEIRANVVYFDGLKKGLYEPTGCGCCAWCRSQKKLTTVITSYSIHYTKLYDFILIF